jgi:hypothetical protein
MTGPALPRARSTVPPVFVAARRLIFYSLYDALIKF